MFSGEYMFPASAADYIPVDKFTATTCPTSSSFTLFYYDQIKVNLAYARRKVSKARSSTPQSYLGALTQTALRCGTQVALQAMENKDLFDCSWTWLPYQYGTNCNACTAFSFDHHTKVYGWLNTRCNRRLHIPCRYANGTYNLTREFHHLANTGVEDRSCQADSHFVLPSSPEDFHSLAMEMLKHGVATVWLPRVKGVTCTDPVSDLSCGHPGIPANGKLTGTNYNFDSTVYYQCKTGWKLVGDVSRVCTSKARWTGKTPLCEKVSCGKPPAPQNTRQYGKSNYYGSKIGYVCRWSYVFKEIPGINSIIITCNAEGQWSGNVPECVRKTCEVSLWSHWSSCSSSCDAGLQTRSRVIIALENDLSALHAGCPALEEERYCNVKSCDTCITGEYEAVVEADNCKSAFPIKNRFCVGNCREGGRCCVPTKKKTETVILFCSGSRPRNYNLQIVEECGCETCTSDFNHSFKRDPLGLG